MKMKMVPCQVFGYEARVLGREGWRDCVML